LARIDAVVSMLCSRRIGLGSMVLYTHRAQKSSLSENMMPSTKLEVHNIS